MPRSYNLQVAKTSLRQVVAGGVRAPRALLRSKQPAGQFAHSLEQLGATTAIATTKEFTYQPRLVSPSGSSS